MTGPAVAAPPTSVTAAAERGRAGMLAVLLLGQFMGLVDVFVVNVALPTIGLDLHASGASLQLVVGAYTIAYAMLLITDARLGDLYGRRRMYLVGAVGFTLTSLACGLAPSGLALILFRFAQGALAPTGGALMWVALVVDGVGMGLAVSPLLALSLLDVPVAQAGDASGLLTTTMQLSQLLGVAVFGTVFLSLRGATAAISATSYGLAVLALAGVVPAVVLARTVLGRTVPARTVSSVVR